MTDEAKALAERLRSRNVFAYPAEGQRLALLAEEAADRIETQAAEIERLREECQAQYDRGYYDGRAALGESHD